MKAKKITAMALFVALGTAAGMFHIPILGAKAFPVQHAINVLAAVIFGPGPAVLIAFLIGLLRNILAMGTLLAFPGGMVGALVAGLMYRAFQRNYAAAVGEVIGTGVLGALLSVPLARLLLGQEATAFAYIIPFGLSSLAGAAVGLAVLKVGAFAWRKVEERSRA